jgi:outer membrane protein
MKSLYRASAALLASCSTLAAAQEAPAPKFEGAAGLILQYKPAFSGSSDFKLKPELAGFLRYGRFTITGAGGFTTKRQDEVDRGIDAELLRRDTVKLNLSLRFDRGRKESASGQLAGMGDIRPTVRGQVTLRWKPVPEWELSAGSSFDALNRVGGYVLSAGAARTFELDGRQRVILGAGASGSGDRYLQAWYGVTPAQSLSSGYPVYTPREGLRDVTGSATYRIEINPQWAAFAGGSASRLLGPAAESPLTTQRNGWALTGGIARRF